MAYFPTESRLGVLGFANVDTTTALPFGTIVRGQDTASGKGGGEFIYLPGAASVAVGSMVTYNAASLSGTAQILNTANQGKPVAVAMAAINTTSKFGWFQVRGVAAVLKTAVKVTPGARVFISATSGRVFPTSTAGKEVLNAIMANAATVVSATSTVNVSLGGAFLQGNIV